MKMLRKVILLGLLPMACMAFGQNSIESKATRINTKKVNFGVMAGFNSAMILVSTLKVDQIKISQIQNNYKVGYFGSLFMRINMQKHFLQPELSYSVSKSDIAFDKLGSHHPDTEPSYASIQSTLHSFDLPILYGYHILKNGPYGMFLFAGPKFSYLYDKENKVTYSGFDQTNIKDKLNPFNISAVMGIGVCISRYFFDFRYEQQIRNLSKSITHDPYDVGGTTAQSTNEIHFSRRSSALSFSLGVIF